MSVRLKDASEKLGISISALCLSKKYKPFIEKTNSKRVTFFDMEKYFVYETKFKRAFNVATLFIEYLRFIEKLTLGEIGGGILHFQAVATHNFSADRAYIFLEWWRDNHPEYVVKYDAYYENSIRMFADVLLSKELFNSIKGLTEK